MAIIKPSELPANATPVTTDVLITEGAAVGKSTIAQVMTAGRPFASQAEAEAGSGTTQTMNPLTTKQSIASEVGSTVQGHDADLDAIAALTSAADKVPYATGAGAWALADFTAAGRAILDDANSAAQRTTLGLGTAAVANLIDEDDMVSNSATALPSQQSVKAYVDARTQSIADLTALAAKTASQVVAGSSVEVLSSPGLFRVLSGSAVSNGYTHDGVVVVENAAGDITFVRKAWRDRREIHLDWFAPATDGTSDSATQLQAWLTRATALAVDAERPAIAVVNPGIIYRTGTQLTVGSFVHVTGGGSIFAHSSLSLTSAVLRNTNTPVAFNTRIDEGIKIYNVTFDGAARSYPVWLTHVAPHPNAGTPVTDPENDYSAPGTIDAVQYTPATIEQVVAEGRRNSAAATTHGFLVYLYGVTDGLVENCRFLNHGSFTVVNGGGLRTHVRRNYFENCGRIDTISPAVLTAALGTAAIITGITKANPADITTASPHQIAAAGTYRVQSINWAGQIADQQLTAVSVTSTTITTAINSSGFAGTYVFDGRALVTSDTYVEAVDCIVENNEFFDLKRIAIQAGGLGCIVRHNTIRTGKEGGIFLSRMIDGQCYGNTIEDLTISDLVCNGIEQNFCTDTVVRDNRISQVDGNGIASVGCYNQTTIGNRSYRSGHRGAVLLPYGIFSERYSFGAPPQVAGIALDSLERAPYRISSYAGVPYSGRFCGNIADDSRATPFEDAALYIQSAGSAPSNTVKNLLIEGNDFTNYPTSDVANLIRYGTNVIDPQTVIVRGNKKHPSQSAFFQVNAAYSAGVTGDQNIVCGFPPSAIEVTTFPANGVTAYPVGISQGSVSKTHAAQAASAAASFNLAWNATEGDANAVASNLWQLVTADGATVNSAATFVQWNAGGFRLNIGTAVTGVYVRIKCYP